MKILFLFRLRQLFLLGMLTGLSACGGGSDGGGKSESQSASDPVSSMGGSVNGNSYNYSGDSRYTHAGSARNLKVVSLEDDSAYWAIQFLNPSPGSYTCHTDQPGGGHSPVIELVSSASVLTTDAPGGACNITVSEASDSTLKGTFDATLIDLENASHRTVSSGSFDILLAAVIPDSDADGISDAEDNCPFENNPQQVDGNDDGIGDLCAFESNPCDPTSEDANPEACFFKQYFRY